jgi:hypothetical protein
MQLQKRQRRTGRIQTLDAGHDIDHRLCRETRKRRTADMFDGAGQSRPDRIGEKLPLDLEQPRPI